MKEMNETNEKNITILNHSSNKLDPSPGTGILMTEGGVMFQSQKMEEIRIEFNQLNYQIPPVKGRITQSSHSSEEGFHRSLIKNLTGSYGSGLNAILGGSGAGKTTFLNLLSKKISSTNDAIVSGQVLANGRQFSSSTFKDFAGFVMQDDHLLATMTVRECFQFAADMKLAELTPEKRLDRVNDTIRILMLQNCQNTFIGDALTKGVSGGERKRCSIGVELIGNPQVLFLDEPTSGLDSFTAYSIINALKNYSEENHRTIIFTIHSPSSDIWNLFSTITLLAEGHIIYTGSRQEILPYFTSLDYQCPRLSNPADYLIAILQSVDSEELERLQQIQRRHASLMRQPAYPPGTSEQQFIGSLAMIDRIGDETPLNKTFFYVIKKLIKRQVLNIKRNRILLRARFVQSLIMNVFLGLVYMNISKDPKNDADAFQIIKTTFFLGMGTIFQGMNPQVITFSVERAAILKEQDAGMYGALTYYLSKILPEILVCSYFAVQMTSIMYFMIGFYATAGQFFFFMLTMVLMGNVGNGIGILASASFKDPKVALVCVNLFMIPVLIFAGVFRNFNEMYPWIAWIRYISPTFYQICALAESQLEGSEFTFDYENSLMLTVGKWESILLLLLYYFVVNIIGYFLLLSKRTKLQ